MSISINVISAIYAWNIPGTYKCPAEDVTAISQTVLDNNQKAGAVGLIQVNNTTMGGDPSPGNKKVFAAVVTINDGGKTTTRLVTCEENVNMDVLTAGEVITLPQ